VAVVREVLDGVLVDPHRRLRPRGLDEGRLGCDLYFLRDRREIHPERKSHRLADFEVQALAHEGPEARQRDGDAVGAERQQRAAEAAVPVRRQGLLEIRRRVPNGDGRARQRRSVRVGHDALNDSGRRLALPEQRPRNHRKADSEKENPHHFAGHAPSFAQVESAGPIFLRKPEGVKVFSILRAPPPEGRS
jgi:hypothetical protein